MERDSFRNHGAAEPYRLRSVLLCSDVHLTDDQPELTRHFCDWLEQQAQTEKPEAILILGDLFDAWVGDDVIDFGEQLTVNAVVDCLSLIGRQGIKIGLMHGNRDFLLGESFARKCAADLLPDPLTITIERDTTITLTHGDQLCTQDIHYQEFRAQVRSDLWQQRFLSQPLEHRLALAKNLRAQSEQEKKGKPMDIMDITPAEAVMLTDQHQSAVLIHGHTHRPGSNVMSNGKTRWVLPDWETNASGTLIRGGGILADHHGIRPINAVSRLTL